MDRQSIMLIYSFCFSVIKSCPRWDSQTLESITEHANQFYDNYQHNSKVPTLIHIYDAPINIQYTTGIDGESTEDAHQSKAQLKCHILQNTNSQTTGFLIRFLNQYISCIVQHNKNQHC